MAMTMSAPDVPFGHHGQYGGQGPAPMSRQSQATEQHTNQNGPYTAAMAMTMSAPDVPFGHHGQYGGQGPAPMSPQSQATEQYTNQNGKAVRVVRYVHYIQAPPGGIESLSQEQQEQFMAEARASIAQRTSSQNGTPCTQPCSQPSTPVQGYQAPAALQPRRVPQALDYNSIHPEGPGANAPHVPSHSLAVSYAAHTAWPVAPHTKERKRPTVGAMVMLNGRASSSKHALREGETGWIVEDDEGMEPFAVQGPRGDVDWYAEEDVVEASERSLPDQRQLLGDQLYARVAAFAPDTASRVVGMFLEALDEAELSSLLVDPTALRQRVAQAHTVIHGSSSPPQPVGPYDQMSTPRQSHAHPPVPPQNHSITSPFKLPPQALQGTPLSPGYDQGFDTAPATPYTSAPTEASSMVMGSGDTYTPMWQTTTPTRSVGPREDESFAT
eukprot:TRINITY_DN3231_c0_g1_i2.p1 TRINITY_DN3231_c0_g1~~TRINITY_DN3231_c0_g1_i2.p1  ORF type:complete len:441 (+),score=87.88 TRINITY_DN3231_c0_g1_i2:48-1370(+)